MNAPFPRRLPGLGLLAALLLALLAPPPSAHAAAWTEPPLVVYGKVLNLGSGTARQVFSGVLHVTLTTTSQPPQVIQRTIELRPVGPAFDFSYRAAIPQLVQPANNEQASGFAVGDLPVRFQIAATYAASANSTSRLPVELLDPAQAQQLFVSPRTRSAEFRVDLVVRFADTDSDGDGLPDWWEDVHGFNKFSAADAGQDADQDGLTNLQEFLAGTNPRSANLNPIVQETLLSVPAGGTAGLALTVIDRDSSPSQIFLSYQSALAGLTWRQQGQVIAPNTEFTYQAVLNGEITLEATPDFDGGRTALTTRDGVFGNTNGSATFPLLIQALSPAQGFLALPVLWLDAARAASNGPTVSEWPDRSGAGRDAYQPSIPAQPLAQDGQVRFNAGRFLHVDDRGLDAPRFTAFLAFDSEAGNGSSQTVFRDADFQLDVQGAAGLRYLRASQSGRATLAAVPRPGLAAVYTLTAGAAQTQLDSPDVGAALSAAQSLALPPAFATVGAAYPLQALAPSNYLQGRVREILLYDDALPAFSRGRLQDYLLARWEGFVAWDQHRAALGVRLAGLPDRRNTLRGGYGDDSLQGGRLGDILRGGPGRNSLAGGAGPDRFAFGRDLSQDVITDFNAADGDVVDLTELVDAPTGQPLPGITQRPVTTRGSNNVPRVDTLIEVRYAGPGAAVDQTITLQGVAYLPSSALRLPTVGSVPTQQIVDTTRPDLFLTTPTAGQVIRGATTTLSGRAKDNVGVTLVYYSLNGGSWINPVTVNAWTNWNTDLALEPGTNTVLAFAVDAAGNRSLTNRLSFVSVQTSTFIQVIAGNGSVSPNYDRQQLEIGKAYTVNALPVAGSVLARWLDGAGTVLGDTPALTFIMTRDLTLVAEFVPTPFTAAAGRYVGLFQPTNGSAATISNAGWFTAQVTPSGSFNAQLQQGAQLHTFSGLFSATGQWAVTALPSAPQLAVRLQLDLTGAGLITGTVEGPAGSSGLRAEQAFYSTANPAPQAGQYSVVLSGNTASATEPAGAGALAVNISRTGVVTVNGSLPDGTAVAQSTYLSKAGRWPLYGVPYSKKGVVLGWMHLDQDMAAPAWDLQGTVQWTKPGGTGSRLYPAGFASTLAGLGLPFTNRAPVLGWTSGFIRLEGGNLAQPITNSLTLLSNGRGTGSNALSLSITLTGPKAGLFTGQITDPVSRRVIPLRGSVLQALGEGAGYFLGTNQAGRLFLQP